MLNRLLLKLHVLSKDDVPKVRALISAVVFVCLLVLIGCVITAVMAVLA